MAKGTGIHAVSVVGGVGENPQLQAIRRGAQVLIATPGRLVDFLKRKLVSLDTIRVVVLDEADRMLDMGFLPDVERIIRATPADRQTLFFSATFDTTASALVAKHMKNPERVAIGSTTKPADTIEMHVYQVEHDRKLSLLQHLLKTHQGSSLVFARTKHGADKLAKKLNTAGSQNQRNAALKGFQEGHFRVLVATDVASRGIHVDDIAHVVNYDLPQAPEDFIHRVGRTGRAGAAGVASTFATSAESKDVRAIERVLKTSLKRRELPEGLGREERPAGAPVIVMPSRGANPGARPAFSFKPRRRRFGSSR
jgi:ATP-dependent RNA helicase RhlE